MTDKFTLPVYNGQLWMKAFFHMLGAFNRLAKAANRHNLVVDGMPVKEWAEDMRARLLEIAAKERR